MSVGIRIECEACGLALVVEHPALRTIGDGRRHAAARGWWCAEWDGAWRDLCPRCTEQLEADHE